MRVEMRFILPISCVLLSACSEGLTDYYANAASAPSISGLDVDFEAGTIGGQTVVISGANFGGDPAAITVQFGNQNATVISADDTSVTVTTPGAPTQAGPVDVKVGTVGGQAISTSAYRYDLPHRADNQLAYVTIANDSLSCYGGIHTTDIGGCDSFAYTGQTGIEGRAEGLNFAFSKAHMPFSLGKGGFAPGTDISWEEWAVQVPPVATNSFDQQNNTETLRVDIGEITMTNPALSGDWCADLTGLANFVYNGGDEYLPEDATNPALQGLRYPNATVYSSDILAEEGDCDDDASKSYDLSTLQFCETHEYEAVSTMLYEAEWMPGENFFQGEDESGRLDPEIAVPVTLDIPGAGIDKVDITIPEYVRFEDDLVDDLWLANDPLYSGACADDDDEDRLVNGGDAAVRFRWTPSAVEHNLDDGVTDVNTYIKLTVNYFALSWLGGEGTPMVATITVPDEYNYDSDTGYSYVDLPAWVLYSIPSVDLSYGYEDTGFGAFWGGWGDPDYAYYGYVIVTTDRITEYTISGKVGGTDGDVVLAYTTGDLWFYVWDNPLDSKDTCLDCIDNDGDGWVDEDDPDCQDASIGSEINATSDSSCNDGEDNDGDGLVDAEDDDCIDGTTGESAECSDNVDNDGDGWIDQDDPDCIEGIFEDDSTLGQYSCNDGLDNDGDGWIDSEDNGCTIGDDSEDDGFDKAFECNDGIDNDGHGDVDSLDLRCILYGADSVEENLINNCADGKDNDGDAYIDGVDPDCDRYNSEGYTSTADWPSWSGVLDLECYDGQDNDSDGVTDADDPGCEDGDGEPSGYQASEAAADPAPNSCADGSDNDADGWIDADDADCFTGTEEDGSQDGKYACSDGKDNDGDTLIDADDKGCSSGGDNDESDA
jgi:hypothetical protein